MKRVCALLAAPAQAAATTTGRVICDTLVRVIGFDSRCRRPRDVTFIKHDTCGINLGPYYSCLVPIHLGTLLLEKEKSSGKYFAVLPCLFPI